MSKADVESALTTCEAWLLRDGKRFLLQKLRLPNTPESRGTFQGEIGTSLDTFLVVGTHRSGMPLYERIEKPAYFTNEMRLDRRDRPVAFRRFHEAEIKQGEFLGFAPGQAIKGFVITCSWVWHNTWDFEISMRRARLTHHNTNPIVHIDEVLSLARGETYVAPEKDPLTEVSKEAYRYARRWAKEHGGIRRECVQKLREILAKHPDMDDIIDKIVESV